jgi:site-specific DNA recombinase
VNAVIYARVSTREQEQEGYSIPAQLKLLRDYAFKNGLTIQREFCDSESAKSTGRKSFGEMLTFLKRSKNCTAVLVEKTDRLYRNLDDAATFENLGIEIHFVKTGSVVSKNARPQTKFMHDIELAQARFYSGNLREEVIKGMREKAEQGIYPGRAPFGYRNNRDTRSIEIHPDNSRIVKRIFELYGSGDFSLMLLRKRIREETGKTINHEYLRDILTNPVYLGTFRWAGKSYRGTHPLFIDRNLWQTAQTVLHRANKPKYRKHEFAFRGLLTCARDNCLVTAEIQKQRYIYYRCSNGRGKCDLPYFREEVIADRLGGVLKDIYLPDEVVTHLMQSLRNSQQHQRSQRAQERTRLYSQLTVVRRKMDRAYSDKLDGKIPEDFWSRMMEEWRTEETRIVTALDGSNQPNPNQLDSAQRIFELANKACFHYVTQEPLQKARLLKTVLSNCAVDAVSVYPTYRKPFELIFRRAKMNEWSGRADLNCRPLAPQASALPG